MSIQQYIDILKRGDVAAAAQLLDAPPAPDGFPPFALAVFFGQPVVYRYLLDQGADVT